MRKLFAVLALAVVCALPMLAQNSDKAEIFGGYQYMRFNPGDGFSGLNFNGWNASATFNVKSWIGATADFSGGYNSTAGVDSRLTNFLFGPTVSYRKNDHFTPFAHALFGFAHGSGTVNNFAGTSDNSFAMALGGGVDASITRHLSLRLVQADWLRTDFSSTSQNNARISTGIVYRF